MKKIVVWGARWCASRRGALPILLPMNDMRAGIDNGTRRSGRNLLILIAGFLPALLLGVVWMRQSGIPAVVYMQNVVAAALGLAVAGSCSHRRASTRLGVAIVVLALVLLLATLIAEGAQSVHRWLRIGGVTVHVALLFIPLVLAELDRMLREARVAFACGVMVTVAAVLAMQPDASQAIAFAGSAVLLLALHRKRSRVAAAMLVLLALAGLSFMRTDPLAPVPHVEEIAIRIGARGAAWQAAVIAALSLLLVPFVRRQRNVSTSAASAVAVYLALVIAASYWGNFPVPVLGYGMSAIIGYFAGWTWLHATGSETRPLSRDRSGDGSGGGQ